jgi:hypothetical protein
MYTIATTFSLVLVLASSVTGKDVMLRGAKLNDLEVSSSIVAVAGWRHASRKDGDTASFAHSRLFFLIAFG